MYLGQIKELALILQEVFDDPSLAIDRNTTAEDVPGWDSFSHTILLLTINNRFKIHLPTAIEFNTVGDLCDKISELVKKTDKTTMAFVSA